MQNLKTLREGWGDKQKEEAKLLEDSTIQKRLDQFLELYETFAPQLEETEEIL